jgi:hypothetical protein
MDRQEIVREIQTNLIGIPISSCHPKVERYRPQHSTAGGLVQCMRFDKIRDTKLSQLVETLKSVGLFVLHFMTMAPSFAAIARETAAFQEGGSTQFLPLLRQGFILVTLLVFGALFELWDEFFS